VSSLKKFVIFHCTTYKILGQTSIKLTKCCIIIPWYWYQQLQPVYQTPSSVYLCDNMLMEPLGDYTLWPKQVIDRQFCSLTSNHMLSAKPSQLGFLSLYLQADHFLSMSLERRIYWKLGSATVPRMPHFWLWKIKHFLFCFVSKYYFFKNQH
jgi:hypothetical protein